MQAKAIKIKQLYKEGLSPKVIAKEVGVSITTVYNNIKVRSNKADKDLIIDLYVNKKMEQIEICKKLGLSASLVSLTLKGIPKRPRKLKGPDCPKLTLAIKEEYINTELTHKEVAEKLNVSFYKVQRMLTGVRKSKDRVRPVVYRKTPTEGELSQKVLEMFNKGMRATTIAKVLKIGKGTIRDVFLSLGIEEERVKNLKITDRHTGKVKVRINRNTWGYMDNGRCENEFREFKIKQLGL